MGSLERFGSISPALERHYRVFYVDLPYHGRTEWAADRVRPQALDFLVDWVKTEAQHDTLELLGYSLGAKVGLNLYLRRPDHIDRLWLLAPDGMRTKYLHWAEKLPGFVFDQVAGMSDQPDRLRRWVDGLSSKGVLPPMAHQFVQWNLSTPERRQRAVAMWYTLRDFAVSPKKLKNRIERHDTQVELLLGENDPYIPARVWRRWAEPISQVCVKSRPTGHRLLDRRTAAWIEERVMSHHR